LADQRGSDARSPRCWLTGHAGRRPYLPSGLASGRGQQQRGVQPDGVGGCRGQGRRMARVGQNHHGGRSEKGPRCSGGNRVRRSGEHGRGRGRRPGSRGRDCGHPPRWRRGRACARRCGDRDSQHNHQRRRRASHPAATCPRAHLHACPAGLSRRNRCNTGVSHSVRTGPRGRRAACVPPGTKMGY
jgi:hypothetical protein